MHIRFEQSSLFIHKFHYGYIKNKFDDRSRLLFADTNSLMHEIKTEDIYVDFIKNKIAFDFRNFSTKSKFCDDSKKLVVGKMESETADVPIKQFIRF